MEIFRCEGICKSFGGVRALTDIHIEFPSSGIVAIIGPNGAGKTTFVNVLTGFLKPDVGRFFLGQREITYLPPHKLARLGISRTFQDVRLIFQISVIDNVLLSRPRQRGERLQHALLRLGVGEDETQNRKEASRLLNRVGLEGHLGELAGELSYGQQKLLTLACCLAAEARILFLDEPIAGVHPNIASEILGLLKHLGSKGKLVIFIEHNISAVRQVADLVIVMDGGQIIAQGRPSDVLERPEILEAYIA